MAATLSDEAVAILPKVVAPVPAKRGHDPRLIGAVPQLCAEDGPPLWQSLAGLARPRARQHFAGSSKSDRHDHMFVCLLSRRELVAVSCLFELTLYGSALDIMEHTISCGPIDDDIDAFALTQCKQGIMVARPTRSGALKESPGALGSIAVNHLSRPAMWHSLRWHSLQCSTTYNGRICNVGPPRGYLARPEGAEDVGAPGQLSLAVETGSLAFIASAADRLRE